MGKYPVAHRINAGREGYMARDWYTREQISVGKNIGDVSKLTAEEIRARDSTDKNYVSKFLGCRSDDEDDKNLHIGDVIIAYAPNKEVLLGVGTVVSEPWFERNPRLLTNEDRHHYWRDIKWRPWSKPVTLDQLGKVESRFKEGEDQVYNANTLTKYDGDFTGLKDAIEECDSVDLDAYQRN